jgi:hypothetical protein
VCIPVAKILLQFHAEPGEIVEFAKSWAEGTQLQVSGEGIGAEWVEPIAAKDLRPDSPAFAGVNLLHLTPAAAVLEASTSEEFHRHSPGALTIHIGKRSADALRESFLGAITEKDAELALWRRIRRQAAGSMHKGVWVVNPISNARHEYKNHYYTEGAMRLASQGVRMLPIAGWNEYEFPSQ